MKMQLAVGICAALMSPPGLCEDPPSDVVNLLDKTFYTRLGGVATNNMYGEPRHFSITLQATL